MFLSENVVYNWDPGEVDSSAIRVLMFLLALLYLPSSTNEPLVVQNLTVIGRAIIPIVQQQTNFQFDWK